MATNDPEIDALLQAAARGNDSALRDLLARHRLRLRRMVAVRLDNRLSARVDPSDIVQEALVDAGRKLVDYARDQPLPFYSWLRQIAQERIIQTHRYHLQSKRREVGREVAVSCRPADGSTYHLADRLAASGTSPSGKVIRDERRALVIDTLEQMVEADREVLVMRYLEGMSFGEIAEVTDATEGAVKVRHFRALGRIRVILSDESLG